MERAEVSRRTVPATAITEPAWLDDQLDLAAARYGCRTVWSMPLLGVLWWYSASSALLGPPVDALLRTGVGAAPELVNLSLVLHADGMVLDAVADDGPEPVPQPGAAALGARLGAPLATAIGTVAGRSGAATPTLWAIASDALANRVLWAGGEPAVAEELAARTGERMPVPRYLEVAGQLVVRRSSCCLIYQATGEPKCLSCPRQHPDERRRRLLAALGKR